MGGARRSALVILLITPSSDRILVTATSAADPGGACSGCAPPSSFTSSDTSRCTLPSRICCSAARSFCALLHAAVSCSTRSPSTAVAASPPCAPALAPPRDPALTTSTACWGGGTGTPACAACACSRSTCSARRWFSAASRTASACACELPMLPGASPAPPPSMEEIEGAWCSDAASRVTSTAPPMCADLSSTVRVSASAPGPLLPARERPPAPPAPGAPLHAPSAVCRLIPPTPLVPVDSTTALLSVMSSRFLASRSSSSLPMMAPHASSSSCRPRICSSRSLRREVSAIMMSRCLSSSCL
mmetsp:Transcript_20785/g.52823  ORF Transcript_20785/g.52823 Transcript_20785/m.52823 type:complete len:302 (-) Transcript_20785:621-1526(-)